MAGVKQATSKQEGKQSSQKEEGGFGRVHV